MASTYTTNLSLNLQATGDNPNAWGTILNSQVFTIVDQALGSKLSLSVAGNSNVTLSTSQSQNLAFNFTGALTGNINVVFPTSAGRLILVTNGTSGSFTLGVQPSGGTAILIPQGTSMLVQIDGATNIAQNGANLIIPFETTVASASTTDLSSGGSNVVAITGTTTITSFGSNAVTTNCLYYVRFTGALTLTYNATSLILPGATNITTAAGDTAIFKYEGSGNWRCLIYQPASGLAPIASPAFTGTPTVPTASVGTNNTQAASTAFAIKAAYTYSNGFLNKFRNPSMDIAQRGTSGTVSTGTEVYTIDGWRVGCTGATLSWSQTGNLGSSASSLTLTGATGITVSYVEQRIESYVAAALAGSQVTVQFTITNNTGSSLTPTITSLYPTARDNYASTTTDLAVTNLQTIANGATGVVAYTFPASANAVNGYVLAVGFGTALNSNAKSVVISSADVRPTPGISTGLNSNPPVPELRPITIEILASQRYFYQPVSGFFYATGYSPTSGSTITISQKLPVTMRTTPTVSGLAWTLTSANTPSLVVSSVDNFAYSVSSTTSGGTFSAISQNGLTFSAEL